MTTQEPILPGAEPFFFEGNDIGVLVSHGFTGSPYSVRPWAERFVEEGYAVEMPRLPGHGTSWQEMNGTGWSDWYAEITGVFGKLRADNDLVFLAGLLPIWMLCALLLPSSLSLLGTVAAAGLYGYWLTLPMVRARTYVGFEEAERQLKAEGFDVSQALSHKY